eukprot:scaffold6655_cov169-Amphora_coffeaeformis.AAC.14
MRLFTLVVLVSSVCAFAPGAQQSTKSTARSAVAPEKEVGVLPPFGFFDPLGFVKNGPYGGELENFRRYR